MDVQKIMKLVEFDTPTVANGLEMLGVRDPSAGYAGPDVRALTPELGVRVGVAVTARLDTTSPGTDHPPSLWNEWLRHMQEAARDDGSHPVPVFGVIESVGPRPRHTVTLGDGMATVMKMAGVVGFITNGAIRDIEGVRAVPLACWGAGLSPMHGRMRWLDVNSPVVIDGMTVQPGDFIHADVNGAIVIPARAADQVYDMAKSVREKEQAFFAKLRSPGMTLDAYLASR
ncbi:MAG: RraA family protein [Planctomycetes bacterium]|nr:RraA family protein [Planctomycetota bacterium]